MEIEQKTSTENKMLRINLDGKWTSSDFTNLFESLTLLYRLFIEIEKIDYLNVQLYSKIPKSEISKNIIQLNGELFRKLNFGNTFDNSDFFAKKTMSNRLFLRQFKASFIDLQINQIKYASPGFTDVVGIGKIIENVLDLIKHYVPNKNQRLINESLELDILEKKIEVLKSIGYSEKEIQKFIDVRNATISNLVHLKMLEKINSFELRKIEE